MATVGYGVENSVTHPFATVLDTRMLKASYQPEDWTNTEHGKDAVCTNQNQVL